MLYACFYMERFVRVAAICFSAMYAGTDSSRITMGVLLPLHFERHGDGCRSLFPLGLGTLQAIHYATEKINNDTTFLPNVTLDYCFYDYCLDSALAAEKAYQMLHSDNRSVVAVIGPTESGIAVHIASLFAALKVPDVSPSATSDELSSPLYSHFYRTIPSDAFQAKAVADIIQYFNWSYIATVAVDDSFGRYGIAALESEADLRGTFCLAFSLYMPRSIQQNKMHQIVSKLKQNHHIKVIVLWSYQKHLHLFLQESLKQNLVGRTFLMPEISAAFDLNFFKPYKSIVDGCLGTAPHRYENKEYKEYLTSLGQRVLEDHDPMKQLLQKANNNASSTNSREELKIPHELLKDMQTAYAPYTIDAVYAIAHALEAMFKCQEPYGPPYGFLREERCPQLHRPIKAEELHVYLQNVHFNGVTGDIRFDKSRSLTRAEYDIVNLHVDATQQNIELVKIGSWKWSHNRSTLLLSDNSVKWSSQSRKISISVCKAKCSPGTQQTKPVACCWECLQCPEGTVSEQWASSNCSKCPKGEKPNSRQTGCEPLPLINIQWHDVPAVCLTTFIILGLCCTLLVLGIFLKYRTTVVVKSSNSALSFLLLAAVACGFVLALIDLAKPIEVLCRVARPWRFTVLTLCVSILFVKTLRILCAFDAFSQSFWVQTFAHGGKAQVLSILLLLSFQLVLVTCWIQLDPPYVHVDINRADEHTFLSCRPYGSATGKYLQACLMTYLAVLSLLCTFLAFRARNFPENFNEAKYIGLSMYILLLSWLNYYPVDSFLDDWYVAIVGCATMLTCCYGLLACIFVPKVFVLLLHPEMNTSEYMRQKVSNYSFNTTVIRVANRSSKVIPINSSDIRS